MPMEIDEEEEMKAARRAARLVVERWLLMNALHGVHEGPRYRSGADGGHRAMREPAQRPEARLSSARKDGPA